MSRAQSASCAVGGTGQERRHRRSRTCSLRRRRTHSRSPGRTRAKQSRAACGCRDTASAAAPRHGNPSAAAAPIARPRHRARDAALKPQSAADRESRRKYPIPAFPSLVRSHLLQNVMNADARRFPCSAGLDPRDPLPATLPRVRSQLQVQEQLSGCRPCRFQVPARAS